MPLITVEHLVGQLSTEQKSNLAEELTRVLLEIEGGGDTPFGRAGHPVLDHPRNYFDAKDHLYDAHGFPENTTGRGLDRY